MKLIPYISETVWGGKRLVAEYGVDPRGKANCAEAWVLSAHPNGPGLVANGVCAGRTLEDLFAAQPNLFGKKAAGLARFPILVKLIDAQDDLSIQVHPRGSESVLLPGEAGKTECWYILDAQPGAKLYLGFQRELLREEFAAAIQSQTLMDYVRPFEVRAGEFYFIPAGTLHAIGGGVLLAEVQQSSDTTYRVYDYGRLQNGRPRPLHIEQALAVTDLRPYEPPEQKIGSAGCRTLCRCEYFEITEFRHCYSAYETEQGILEESFASLLFLEGEAVLRSAAGELLCRKGESVLVPAGMPYDVEGTCRALITRL
jgi:mannose-6-phosphate isomerase class I